MSLLDKATSLINPASAWISANKILVFLGYSGILFIGGFYSGCEYKQNQWDAEKFRALQKAVKQEISDKVAGKPIVENLSAAKEKGKSANEFIAAQPKKPLVRIVAAPVVTPKIEVHTQPGTAAIEKPNSEVKKDEAPTLFLTANFMRMYDVSVAPENIGLRIGTYEESRAPTLDEGFEKVIIPNNILCYNQAKQLNALLDRIEAKRKIFN